MIAMEIREHPQGAQVCGLEHFNLEQIFDSGQCFRWQADGDGYLGVVNGSVLRVVPQADGFLADGLTVRQCREQLIPYFDLERDYCAICESLSRDPVMARASAFGSGLRILRQDPWEMVITFILSAANHIPRIKGIIERLCAAYGSPISYRRETYYSFPRAETLAALTPQELSCIRAGFRTDYLLDAARRVADGRLDLSLLAQLPYPEAKRLLLEIKGVGVKVADCILLFGAGQMEAFPIDTWMKKAISHFYGSAPFDPARFGTHQGIAQQYLFYYAREHKIAG